MQVVAALITGGVSLCQVITVTDIIIANLCVCHGVRVGNLMIMAYTSQVSLALRFSLANGMFAKMQD